MRLGRLLIINREIKMKNNLLQQDDIVKSCAKLASKTTSSYNSTTMATSYSKYYENNSTLPSIHFESHDNAFSYFKNVTSSIEEYCNNFSHHTPDFYRTETLFEAARLLIEHANHYTSIFCEKIYYKVGVEMMEYACNSDTELDNFYLDLTNATRTELTGHIVDQCVENCT